MAIGSHKFDAFFLDNRCRTDGTWCSPPDDNVERFVIIFDDPEVEMEVYTDEAVARSAFARHESAWSCHLLSSCKREAG